MLPRVIMYNTVSVDGWIDNIHPDLGHLERLGGGVVLLHYDVVK